MKRLYRYQWLRMLPALLLGGVLLGGCTKDPVETVRGSAGDKEHQIELYIPAPEKVTVYGAATANECRIENVAVLTWDKATDRVKGAEEVELILGNGTQNPTLQLVNLFPEKGDHVIVVANYNPNASDIPGCVGHTLEEAQSEKIIAWTPAYTGGGGTLMAQLRLPLLMAGEMVWGEQTPPLRMTFQATKLSVVLEPALTAPGGLWENATAKFEYYRIPLTTRWETVSAPNPENSEGKYMFRGNVGDPATPTNELPAIYAYESALPSVDTDKWAKGQAYNTILFAISYPGQSASEYYGLTYDRMNDDNTVAEYRPFERGRHYIFRIRNIYGLGYDSRDEAMVNPSNVVYDVEVSDDWSTDVEYNGQYAITADRDTAYVFMADGVQNLLRFKAVHPEGNAGKMSGRVSLNADVADVQLLDQNGNPFSDSNHGKVNYFDLETYPISAEEGLQLKFKAKRNPGKEMFLTIQYGNIRQKIPVGWCDFSAEDVETTYQGGQIAAQITSQVAFGDRIESLGWTAEFVGQDGNSIPRPAWIAGIPSAGSGNVTVTVQPQVNGSKMQPGAAVSNLDLSTERGAMNTANCYIVHAPGTYRLPLVYGNAIKNGVPNPSSYTSTLLKVDNTPKRLCDYAMKEIGEGLTDDEAPYIYNKYPVTAAKLLWQDVDGMISDVATDGKYLTFRVSDKIDYGNAVVAAFSGDDIVWSWHIWATDYDPYAADGTIAIENRTPPNTTLTFMKRNLGESPGASYDMREARVRFAQKGTGVTATVTITQAEYRALGFSNYYRWGCKDPYPGAPWIGSRPTYEPLTVDNNNWSINRDLNYFDTDPVVKTVYDPSPAGFCVPPRGAFSGFIDINASLSDNKSQFNVEGKYDRGWNFYSGLDRTGETIYFGGYGLYDYYGDEFRGRESDGYYWTAAYCSGLYFRSSRVNPQYYDTGSVLGASIRSVREF